MRFFLMLADVVSHNKPRVIFDIGLRSERWMEATEGTEKKQFQIDNVATQLITRYVCAHTIKHDGVNSDRPTRIEPVPKRVPEHKYASGRCMKTYYARVTSTHVLPECEITGGNTSEFSSPPS